MSAARFSSALKLTWRIMWDVGNSWIFERRSVVAEELVEGNVKYNGVVAEGTTGTFAIGSE